MQFSKFAKLALMTTVAAAITADAFAVEAAATTSLNVRTGPGTSFAVLDTLFTGEVVDVTECQANGWCMIYHSGPDGWVSGKYLSEVQQGTPSQTPSGQNNSGNSGNSNNSGGMDADDAAAAAVMLGIIGIGAAMLGASMANDNQPNQPAGPVMAPEDCIGFNPNQVQASFVNGSWKVVQGGMSMLDFGNRGFAATKAANTIRAYGFTQQCFVKRPNAAMMYWKTGNSVPSNTIPNQDCLAHNPATVSVSNVGGRWKVVDGGHALLDFAGDKTAADQALAVIQTYNLNRQCFVKRPNASMTYWLAQ